MKENLTLTIDKETKQRAKRHAETVGKSVSQIVEDLLNEVSDPSEQDIRRERQLAEAGIDDWVDHLE
jgi:antitoxin component of RelBE/YafQ-DinJ toxin-antitoxin module